MEGAEKFANGNVVLLRSVYRGRVRWTFPHWVLRGWHVNLQSQLVETARGFDTTDWALDVWVAADGSWEWKDEDDFVAMRTLGVFDDAAAAEVRAEGGRVIAAWPFPTGWEDWRPDPAWTPPELPEDWHVVD